MSGSISSIVFGLAAVGIGLALLLNNLGITSISIGALIGRYWPVLLVAMGLSSLLGRRGTDGAQDGGNAHRGHDARHTHEARIADEDDDERGEGHVRITVGGHGGGSNVGGWALLIVGMMLLAGTAGWYRFNWARFWGVAWAVLIMALGWAILRGRPFDGSESEGGYGSTRWVIMSGLELKQPGWLLESGSYVVLMGSVELDLRQAVIRDGVTYLDLSAMMGGIEIIVPDGLAVECEGSAILGGVEFFRQSAGGIVSGRTFVRTGEPGSPKILKIRCRALMGAVELK